jgi:hypothetical protein
LETRGPQLDERVPDSQMPRRQYENGVLAQQHRRDRFDGRGMPRFWPEDRCATHPHGEQQFLQSGNPKAGWRCMQCYGDFSDSIKHEMGRWTVVPTDDPPKVVYVAAGRGQPGMAAAFGGRVHEEF